MVETEQRSKQIVLETSLPFKPWADLHRFYVETLIVVFKYEPRTPISGLSPLMESKVQFSKMNTTVLGISLIFSQNAE